VKDGSGGLLTPSGCHLLLLLLLLLMLLLLLLCLCAAYLRFTLVDEELAKPDGGGVLFFSRHGKHRSAAAVACYLARCTGLRAETVMAVVSIKSGERGDRHEADGG